MSKKCMGCGIIMQDKDLNAPGYTPNITHDYCKRCFQLKHYGIKKENESISEEEILNKVNKAKGLAFFFVDFYHINKKSMNIFKRIDLSKVLVISKCDTLRKEMKPEKIITWLKKVYKIDEQVIFVSNKDYVKSLNILKVMESKNIHKAYLLGLTNAGKSTTINKLLKANNIKKEILVNKKPNTTLDFIKIKIKENILFDTPGFNLEDNTLINEEIKPLSYQINKNTTLIIDKNMFTFLNENKVVYYGKNKIERKYDINIDGQKIKVEKNSDIVLFDSSFLNIKEECELITNSNILEIRPNFSGDNNE